MILLKKKVFELGIAEGFFNAILHENSENTSEKLKELNTLSNNIVRNMKTLLKFINNMHMIFSKYDNTLLLLFNI